MGKKRKKTTTTTTTTSFHLQRKLSITRPQNRPCDPTIEFTPKRERKKKIWVRRNKKGFSARVKKGTQFIALPLKWTRKISRPPKLPIILPPSPLMCPPITQLDSFVFPVTKCVTSYTCSGFIMLGRIQVSGVS